MNFVTYDPVTYAALVYGTAPLRTLEAIIAQGDATIIVEEMPSDFALHLYDVDPVTKTLVRASPPRPDPNAPSPPEEATTL